MLICKECRCFHPVSVSDRYCGDCCIGDTRNAIAINEDITECCLFEPKQPKPQKRMTNGDRIRQMTDEKLADFLDTITDCCNALMPQCDKCPMKYQNATPRCAIDLWLKQEVSEDAGTD